MSESIYRGYRLVLQASGSGWKVLIHAPGVSENLPMIPSTPEMYATAKVLEEAKRIVDQELAHQ